jgi:hypothetical protein
MCPKSSKSKIEKKEPLGELANKVGRNPEIVKVILSSMSVKDQLKVRFQLSTQSKPNSSAPGFQKRGERKFNSPARRFQASNRSWKKTTS